MNTIASILPIIGAPSGAAAQLAPLAAVAMPQLQQAGLSLQQAVSALMLLGQQMLAISPEILQAAKAGLPLSLITALTTAATPNLSALMALVATTTASLLQGAIAALQAIGLAPAMATSLAPTIATALPELVRIGLTKEQAAAILAYNAPGLTPEQQKALAALIPTQLLPTIQSMALPPVLMAQTLLANAQTATRELNALLAAMGVPQALATAQASAPLVALLQPMLQLSGLPVTTLLAIMQGTLSFAPEVMKALQATLPQQILDLMKQVGAAPSARPLPFAVGVSNLEALIKQSVQNTTALLQSFGLAATLSATIAPAIAPLINRFLPSGITPQQMAAALAVNIPGLTPAQQSAILAAIPPAILPLVQPGILPPEALAQRMLQGVLRAEANISLALASLGTVQAGAIAHIAAPLASLLQPTLQAAQVPLSAVPLIAQRLLNLPTDIMASVQAALPQALVQNVRAANLLAVPGPLNLAQLTAALALLAPAAPPAPPTIPTIGAALQRFGFAQPVATTIAPTIAPAIAPLTGAGFTLAQAVAALSLAAPGITPALRSALLASAPAPAAPPTAALIQNIGSALQGFGFAQPVATTIAPTIAPVVPPLTGAGFTLAQAVAALSLAAPGITPALRTALLAAAVPTAPAAPPAPPSVQNIGSALQRFGFAQPVATTIAPTIAPAVAPLTGAGFTLAQAVAALSLAAPGITTALRSALLAAAPAPAAPPTPALIQNIGSALQGFGFAQPVAATIAPTIAPVVPPLTGAGFTLAQAVAALSLAAPGLTPELRTALLAAAVPTAPAAPPAPPSVQNIGSALQRFGFAQPVATTIAPTIAPAVAPLTGAGFTLAQAVAALSLAAPGISPALRSALLAAAPAPAAPPTPALIQNIGSALQGFGLAQPVATTIAPTIAPVVPPLTVAGFTLAQAVAALSLAAPGITPALRTALLTAAALTAPAAPPTPATIQNVGAALQRLGIAQAVAASIAPTVAPMISPLTRVGFTPEQVAAALSVNAIGLTEPQRASLLAAIPAALLPVVSAPLIFPELAVRTLIERFSQTQQALSTALSNLNIPQAQNVAQIAAPLVSLLQPTLRQTGLPATALLIIAAPTLNLSPQTTQALQASLPQQFLNLFARPEMAIPSQPLTPEQLVSRLETLGAQAQAARIAMPTLALPPEPSALWQSEATQFRQVVQLLTENPPPVPAQTLLQPLVEDYKRIPPAIREKIEAGLPKTLLASAPTISREALAAIVVKTTLGEITPSAALFLMTSITSDIFQAITQAFDQQNAIIHRLFTPTQEEVRSREDDRLREVQQADLQQRLQRPATVPKQVLVILKERFENFSKVFTETTHAEKIFEVVLTSMGFGKMTSFNEIAVNFLRNPAKSFLREFSILTQTGQDKHPIIFGS